MVRRYVLVRSVEDGFLCLLRFSDLPYFSVVLWQSDVDSVMSRAAKDSCIVRVLLSFV